MRKLNNRCNVSYRIDVPLLQTRIDRVTGRDQGQGITVRRRLHADFHADGSTGARTVVHDKLLADSSSQFLRGHARDKIAAAAGWERNDEAVVSQFDCKA